MEDNNNKSPSELNIKNQFTSNNEEDIYHVNSQKDIIISDKVLKAF